MQYINQIKWNMIKKHLSAFLAIEGSSASNKILIQTTNLEIPLWKKKIITLLELHLLPLQDHVRHPGIITEKTLVHYVKYILVQHIIILLMLFYMFSM